jgi:hypothetical protein
MSARNDDIVHITLPEAAESMVSIANIFMHIICKLNRYSVYDSSACLPYLHMKLIYLLAVSAAVAWRLTTTIYII